MLSHVLADNDTRKKTLLLLLALLGIVSAVRFSAYGRLHVIDRDGIVYLGLAQDILSGSFREALSHPYHPLYSMLIAGLSPVTDNLESASRLINVALSCLTVVPLFFFGKTVAGSRIGFIAGIFYAFQPYSVRFSVDVMSDPAFLFFFMATFALGVQGRLNDTRDMYWGLAAGVSAGVAYLLRPEGVLAVGLLILWYGALWIGNRKAGRTGLLRCVSALVVAFIFMAFPYLLFIKAHTGEWMLTMKPSFQKSLQNFPLVGKQSPPEPVPMVTNDVSIRTVTKIESGPPAPAKVNTWVQNPRFLHSVVSPLSEFIETYPYVLFFFFIIGCWISIGQGIFSSSAILGGLTFAYLAALCYLFDSVGYVSRRHFIPLVTISLPIAAIGFTVVEQMVFAWAIRREEWWALPLARRAALMLMLVTVAALAPKALKAQGVDKIPVREAAEWIKTHSRSASPLVMCNEPRAAYYAEGRHMTIPPLPYDAFVRFVLETGVDYVVFREREVREGKEFISQVQPNHFRRVPFESEHVQVYEVVRPEPKQHREESAGPPSEVHLN